MSAISLAFNEDVGAGDIAFANGRIVTGDALQTLVYTSLFTDAYAGESDLPGQVEDRGGTWSDAFLPVGESHGSHLWLLQREKILPDVIKSLRDRAQQALNWLVDEGHARAIVVSAERHDLQTIALHVLVTRPNGTQQQITVNI